MPESEEDLRQFLRKEVAEQRQAVEQARWRAPFHGLLLPDPDRGVIDPRLMAPNPLYGDLELGQLDEAPPGPEASPSAPDPSAAAPPPPAAGAATQTAAAAPIIPPPRAAVVAEPAPAQGGRLVRQIMRALAVFGAVIAPGAGVLIAQRSPGDLKVWLFVAVALAVCAAVFIGAGRSLAADRDDPGDPPIVR